METEFSLTPTLRHGCRALVLEGDLDMLPVVVEPGLEAAAPASLAHARPSARGSGSGRSGARRLDVDRLAGPQRPPALAREHLQLARDDLEPLGVEAVDVLRRRQAPGR